MSPGAIRVLGMAATLYGLGGALSVLLQARRMHVRGTSGDVSARFFAVYVGGFAIWLLYGSGIGSVPIVLVHAVGLLCGAVTLAVVLRLRRPPPWPRRPDRPAKPKRDHDPAKTFRVNRDSATETRRERRR